MRDATESSGISSRLWRRYLPVAMGGAYSTDTADETATINIDLTADGVNASDVVFEFWRVRHCS